MPEAAGRPEAQICRVCSICSCGAVPVVVWVSELGAMSMVLPVVTEGVGFVEGRSHGCVEDDDADDE